MQDGAVAGFKYFNIRSLKTITVELKGKAEGIFLASEFPDFKKTAFQVPVKLNTKVPEEIQGICTLMDGTKALYFKFEGTGSVDFLSFTLGEQMLNA
jgi:hypothetical protein